MLQKITIENTEILKSCEHFLTAAYSATNSLYKKFQKAENRIVYNPPKSYIEMLNLFQIMILKKRNDNEEGVKRLEKGVEKLKRAAADVNHLEGSLQFVLFNLEFKF